MVHHDWHTDTSQKIYEATHSAATASKKNVFTVGTHNYKMENQFE